jgi:hypothetical protein
LLLDQQGKRFCTLSWSVDQQVIKVDSRRSSQSKRKQQDHNNTTGKALLSLFVLIRPASAAGVRNRGAGASMAWLDWGIRLAIGVSAARQFAAFLFLALLLLLKQLTHMPEESLKRNSSRSKPAGFG